MIVTFVFKLITCGFSNLRVLAILLKYIHRSYNGTMLGKIITIIESHLPLIFKAPCLYTAKKGSKHCH